MDRDWWKPRFKTKKALIEEIRAIAGKTTAGSKITDDERSFMMQVFSMHDEFDEKVGRGVSEVIVERDRYGNKMFVIERIDGTRVDISWTHCISPQSSARKHFVAALRTEIEEQIHQFRNTCGNVCGICGKPLSGKTHVDHVVPFRNLVQDFFGEKVHDTIDMGEYSLLSDRGVAKSWCDYHANNAKLQISHDKCNMMKG